MPPSLNFDSTGGCEEGKTGQQGELLNRRQLLNATFAAMAEHNNTTILPARPGKPKDKAKVEGSVLVVLSAGFLPGCVTGASSRWWN